MHIIFGILLLVALLYIARETIRSILRIVKSYVQTKKSENIFSHRLQALFKEQKTEFYIVFAPVIPIVFFLTDYSGITFFVILLYGVPIILIIYLLTKLVFFIKLKLYKSSAVNDDHTFFKFLNQEKLPIIILLIILFHYSGLFFGILYGHSYLTNENLGRFLLFNLIIFYMLWNIYRTIIQRNNLLLALIRKIHYILVIVFYLYIVLTNDNNLISTISGLPILSVLFIYIILKYFHNNYHNEKAGRIVNKRVENIIRSYVVVIILGGMAYLFQSMFHSEIKKEDIFERNFLTDISEIKRLNGEGYVSGFMDPYSEEWIKFQADGNVILSSDSMYSVVYDEKSIQKFASILKKRYEDDGIFGFFRDKDLIYLDSLQYFKLKTINDSHTGCLFDEVHGIYFYFSNLHDWGDNN